MTTNLFTKPIDTISFSDIKSFCDAKIAENVKIEYKEDFPEDLAKYIAGFANKFGGIIIIGVKADKTKNVPININGIELVNGLEEKVINISLSNTNPFIIPEVKICDFKSKENIPKSDRAIIFIRVSESFETPHMYLKEDNRIYERIHNETRPADVDTIRKLIEKSEKGKEIFNRLFSEYLINKRHDGFRTVFILPASPVKQIIKFNLETDRLLKEKQPSYLKFGDFRAVQNGVQFHHIHGGDTEITQEGLIRYSEPWPPYDFNGKKNDTINIDRTMINLIQILRYTREVFDYVGYHGKICFGMEITGTFNKKILSSNPLRHLDREYTSEEGLITIQNFFTYDEFINILVVVKSITEVLLRSFGLVIEEKTLNDWIKEYIK